MHKELKKEYNHENDIYGLPQTYKGVQFFPLKLNNKNESQALQLLFGKSKKEVIYNIKDMKVQKQIYKVSYFKMLMSIITMSFEGYGINVPLEIKRFFMYICKIDNPENVSIHVIEKDGYMPTPEEILTMNKVKIVLKIGDVEFSEKEFDILRELILTQNGLSLKYIEEYNPELEKLLKAYNDMSSNNNKKSSTFSDDICTYATLLKIPLSDMKDKDLTLFQFKTQYERLKINKEFDLIVPLEISGAIKTKEPIMRYDAPTQERGRYDAILVGMDKFKENDIFKATTSI